MWGSCSYNGLLISFDWTTWTAETVNFRLTGHENLVSEEAANKTPLSVRVHTEKITISLAEVIKIKTGYCKYVNTTLIAVLYKVYPKKSYVFI